MKIFYTQKAIKQIKSLDKPEQERLAEKMRFFAVQKNPLCFAKRLTNYHEGEYRFRIGGLRIIFDIKDNAIFILKIAKRSIIYE